MSLDFIAPANNYILLYTSSESYIIYKKGTICDWAYENLAYLHKLHMFRKWYFS